MFTYYLNKNIMKTNFTITKRLLFAFAALAFVASSCDKTPEVVPDPEIAGIYNFTSATLIDGNIGDATTTNLVIENGGGPGVTADVPAGDVATTSFFVNAVLSGLAPCVDALTPVTYQINIKSDGGLAFICTSEGGTSVDNGTWVFADDNKTVVLTIESSTLGTVVVKIETATFVTGDAGVISGTMNTFPMIINAGLPIGATNLQFIAFDVVLSK